MLMRTYGVYEHYPANSPLFNAFDFGSDDPEVL